MTQQKQIVGRAELVDLPELAIEQLPARIDTGAKTTSIWASSITETAKGLEVIFLGPDHPQYTGKKHLFSSYDQGMVASSNGQAELRYRIRTPIRIEGRRVRATFTLADRSTQVYPVLVGRNVLRGKFIVDVQYGSPQTDLERARSKALQQAESRKGTN